METTGWEPRAAGWFTRPLDEGCLAVVAIGTASKHYSRGEAEATAYVGVRHEATEQITSYLCDVVDRSYQQRTAVRPIGYLMPDRRWRGWHVTAETVEQSAVDLARAINTHGLPFLNELASDPLKLVQTVKNSAGIAQATGRCRVAVLLATTGKTQEALDFVQTCRNRVAGEDGLRVVQERAWTDAFERWLRQNDAPKA
jgi:hypothetical protein